MGLPNQCERAECGGRTSGARRFCSELCRKLHPLEVENLRLKADQVCPWRDVRLELPEEDEVVLVCGGDLGTESAWKLEDLHGDFDGWFSPNGWVHGVTHWQPMPAGPEGTT